MKHVVSSMTGKHGTSRRRTFKEPGKLAKTMKNAPRPKSENINGQILITANDKNKWMEESKLIVIRSFCHLLFLSLVHLVIRSLCHSPSIVYCVTFAFWHSIRKTVIKKLGTSFVAFTQLLLCNGATQSEVKPAHFLTLLGLQMTDLVKIWIRGKRRLCQKLCSFIWNALLT